jgi:hypothetical protein
MPGVRHVTGWDEPTVLVVRMRVSASASESWHARVWSDGSLAPEPRQPARGADLRVQAAYGCALCICRLERHQE